MGMPDAHRLTLVGVLALFSIAFVVSAVEARSSAGVDIGQRGVGDARSRPVKWCKRERHPVEHIYAAAFSRSASGRASSML